MKFFFALRLAIIVITVTGCIHSKPIASGNKAAIAIVTPDNSLSGKVISYSATGRFLVLNFPDRRMPKADQTLFLYRSGLKVAEVKVTGPQNEDNIVADLVNGDAKSGDDVRDR